MAGEAKRDSWRDGRQRMGWSLWEKRDAKVSL